MKHEIKSQTLLYRHILFGWLNFALTVPAIYLLLGLPLIMREQGWSATEIGLFQFTSLPAIFKFLLALPIEHGGFKHNRYRNWGITLCLLLGLLLLVIAQNNIITARMPLFGLALLAGLIATWADIPINALAITLLPESERLRAGAIRSAATYLAAIIGGGFLLLIYARFGWHAPFYLMATALGISALILLTAQKPLPNHRTNTNTIHWQTIIDFKGYFAQPHAIGWTLLLTALFPFIGATWLYLKPLLLDQGIPLEKIALYVGLGGAFVGALTSIVSGRLFTRYGIKYAFPIVVLMNIASMASLALTLWLDAHFILLMASVLLIAIAMGATSALLFGLMMHFTRSNQRAKDYGVQTTLFVFTRLVGAMIAGALLDAVGAPLMLTILTVATIPILGLALIQGKKITPVIARP